MRFRQYLQLFVFIPLSIALFSSKTMAQTGTELIISPVVNPPYSPYVADYQNLQKGLVTITNTTNKTLNIRLEGSIEGNGFYYRTKPNYKPFKAVTVGPKEVKTFFGNTQETDFFSKNNAETNVSVNQFNNTVTSGILPEGIYTLCIKAFDFNTNAPLSQASPVGCFTFNISYPQPPILTCLPTQSAALPVFTWSPPVGFVTGAQIRYDFILLNLTALGGIMPDNEAIDRAIEYNAGNPLRIKDLAIPNYVYGPADPPLVKGAKYGMVVLVKDLNKKMVFQNKGRSEICTFIYSPITPPSPPAAQANNSSIPPQYAANCSCKKAAPNNLANTQPSVVAGSKLKIGYHELTVTEITNTPDSDGKFSGNGTIPIPMAKSKSIKVRVQMSDVKVNSNNEIISGRVIARRAGNAPSLLPKYDNPNFDGSSFSPTELSNLSEYFTTQKEQVISSVGNSINSIGFEMPIGIEKAGQTVAITSMEFTPTQSYFDAMAVIDLLGDNQVIALGGRGICMDAEKMCGDAKLSLTKDFELPFFNGSKMTLKSKTNQKEGTFVEFDGDGFKILHLEADYVFPSSLVKSAVTPAVGAKASITADALSWGKWLGQVQLEPFTIAGVKDFVFKPKDAFYDHDDSKNPQGLPNLYPSLSENIWEGFYIKTVDIELPAFLKTKNQKTTVQAKDLIIDDNGVSTNILAQNIITFGDTKLGSWGASLDSIKIKFLKNAFTEGGLAGKVALPITDQGSQLDYRCLLSYANDSLDFQFSIKPTEKISVPLFLADFNIAPTSNILITKKGNDFLAKAELDGGMSITTTIPVVNIKTKFDAIKFEKLTVLSDTPYIKVGLLKTTFASPDKEFGGFTYGLKSAEIVSSNGRIGLKFEGEIGLADVGGVGLKAGTAITFFGKFANNKPTFDGVEVNKISLAADFSAFNFNGTIEFYKNDATYGNGFSGNVKATIKPLKLGIDVSLKMGATLPSYSGGSFKYWYFDALAILPEGPMLFPGIQAFGFGGGAYYKMTQSNVPQSFALTGNNGTSGAKYIPKSDVALGLKAKIYVGLQGVREAFNGDLGLDISFTNNGGLNQIIVEGNARMISDKDMKKGLITGHAKIIYDNVQEIFSAQVDAEMKQGPVSAKGTLALYFDGAKHWHLKFGTPTQPIVLNFAGFDAVKSYFEAGNYQVDNMPSPDQDILDILNKSGVNWGSTSTLREMEALGGGQFKLIHGAKTGFKYSGEFLIFFGELFAGAGYDVAMLKVATGCDGKEESAKDIGFNGYYGLGQMYAGVKAKIGIDVDLYFVSGRYTIIEAGIGAIVEAGVANPLWCHGAVGGYYSILDGLVEGSCSFEFNIGQACKPGTGDPLSGIKLISDISPRPDNNGKNSTTQDLVMNLGAATNLKLVKGKTMKFEERETGSDKTKIRLFRFHDDLVSATLTKGATSVKLKKTLGHDGFGIVYTPVQGDDSPISLDKTSDYIFKVKANIEECSNVNKSGDNYYFCAPNDWVLAKTKGGQTFEESKSVSFKTGKGFEKIKDEYVKFTTPATNERYFCYQDEMSPSVNMAINFIEGSYNILPTGLNPADYSIKYLAKFTPLSNPLGAKKVDISQINGSKEVKFPFPAGKLSPNTIYRVEIIAQWVKQGSGGNTPAPTGGSLTQVKTTNLLPNWTGKNNTILAQLNNRELILTKLQPQENEKVLYQFHFRTSQYQNLAEKLNVMAIYKAMYSEKPNGNNAQAKTATLEKPLVY